VDEHTAYEILADYDDRFQKGGQNITAQAGIQLSGASELGHTGRITALLASRDFLALFFFFSLGFCLFSKIPFDVFPFFFLALAFVD
jgi:hypothetical protein